MDLDEKEMDDGTEEESFADLFAESQVEGGRFERGERVEAVIVQITSEWAFLDLGGKSEGYLDRKELLDEKGQLTAQVGDTIAAYFLSSRQNERLFTTRITGGQAARNFIEDACRSAIPVEGVVEKELKGGFEVKIAGTLRAFCPFSLMGLRRIEDPAEVVGQKLSFKVIEYAEGGRKIVLSHRAILEEEQARKKEELKKTLQEGMVVRGTVVSLRDFGAFVDIGGVQGLLPISEIGWARVEDLRDHLTVGQEVEVAVLKLDWEADRISLSLKETLPDPWALVGGKYPDGSVHTGTVARLTDFGAFVTLEAGVDGLIHISKLGGGKRIKHPREVLAVGRAVEVKVEALDEQKRRISLSLAGPDREEAGPGGAEDYSRYAASGSRSKVTLGDLIKSRSQKKVKKK